jgi:hypothetical protein
MAGCKTIIAGVVCGIAIAANLPLVGKAEAQRVSSSGAEAVEANSLLTDTAPRSRDFGAVGAIDRAPQSPLLRDAARVGREPRGNPLWAISLELLSTTRERPIFMPSRRPPAPPTAVADPPRAQVVPPPAEPERLGLALIGAVTGRAAGIAVFLDETTKDVVRLRIGDNHSGWILRSVNGREVIVEKGGERISLALPAAADQDGVVREIDSPTRPPNAAPPSLAAIPSPPPLGDWAAPAITVPASPRSPSGASLAQADGAASSSPMPPPVGSPAPPAVTVPEPPGARAPPAVTVPAMPGDRAPAATTVPAPHGIDGSPPPPPVGGRAPQARTVPRA